MATTAVTFVVQPVVPVLHHAGLAIVQSIDIGRLTRCVPSKLGHSALFRG
jgi:hypothetical protein